MLLHAPHLLQFRIMGIRSIPVSPQSHTAEAISKIAAQRNIFLAVHISVSIGIGKAGNGYNRASQEDFFPGALLFSECPEQPEAESRDKKHRPHPGEKREPQPGQSD